MYAGCLNISHSGFAYHKIFDRNNFGYLLLLKVKLADYLLGLSKTVGYKTVFSCAVL